MTATEMLEHCGVDTTALEQDAEYTFKNILRAMKEYRLMESDESEFFNVNEDNNKIGEK